MIAFDYLCATDLTEALSAAQARDDARFRSTRSATVTPNVEPDEAQPDDAASAVGEEPVAMVDLLKKREAGPPPAVRRRRP